MKQTPEQSAVAFVAHVAELCGIEPDEDGEVSAGALIEENYDSAVAMIEELHELIAWAKRIQKAGLAECSKCGDSGWLSGIEGQDGSYATSRPCSCKKGHAMSRLNPL